jgi:Zn-dependent alcohol dehydrogenase
VAQAAGSLDAAQDLPSFFDLVRTGKLDLSQLVTGRGIRTLLGPAPSP